MTVQFDGIGFAIGPPARGERGEAVARTAERATARRVIFIFPDCVVDWSISCMLYASSVLDVSSQLLVVECRV